VQMNIFSILVQLDHGPNIDVLDDLDGNKCR